MKYLCICVLGVSLFGACSRENSQQLSKEDLREIELEKARLTVAALKEAELEKNRVAVAKENGRRIVEQKAIAAACQNIQSALDPVFNITAQTPGQERRRRTNAAYTGLAGFSVATCPPEFQNAYADLVKAVRDLSVYVNSIPADETELFISTFGRLQKSGGNLDDAVFGNRREGQTIVNSFYASFKRLYNVTEECNKTPSL